MEKQPKSFWTITELIQTEGLNIVHIHHQVLKFTDKHSVGHTDYSLLTLSPAMQTHNI